MNRFVVISVARCGSNLLVDAIRQHPDIFVFSEIFHPKLELRKRWSEIGPIEPLPEDADGATFLANQVYVPRWKKKAVGFKLMTTHAQNESHALVWNYLAADRNVRIIQLYRKNLFAALVSFETASRTGQWSRGRLQAQSPKPVEPFRIEVEHCKRFFWERRATLKWITEKFQGHSPLTLDYEDDLCQKFENTLTDVYAHLGVAPYAPCQRLLKQSSKPIRDLILNYDEIRDSFARTIFAEFFE